MVTETNKFKGIILRTFPYGEADLILRVLSPSGGKRSVLAKNVRREKSRFKIHSDIFDQGTFEVKLSRGSLEPLVDFRPSRSFLKIRNNIDTFVVASHIVECFDRLVHENASDAEEYYDILSLGLRALDEASSTREVLKACFFSLHSLLQISGFGAVGDGAPSLKRLFLLIDKVEQTSEKELVTKPSVLELLNRWGSQNRGESGRIEEV